VPVLWYAVPWWVNLLGLVPIALWRWTRGRPHTVATGQLLWLAVWAVAFGAVEASVVVYLRAIYASTLGYPPTLAAVATVSNLPPTAPITALAADVMRVEAWRELATMVMLVGAAAITTRGVLNRVVAFLWAFAIWDLTYYLWLRVAVGWPASLGTLDVLFLIPQPWISAVWFPIAVSSLTVAAIWLGRQRT
jgi:hypothetical protein